LLSLLPKLGMPRMIASLLCALESPFKVLIRQSGDHRVWVNSTDVSYLQTRYAISPTSLSKVAGDVGFLERVLKNEEVERGLL
jgi:uncharacterized protein (DUF302 family)